MSMFCVLQLRRMIHLFGGLFTFVNSDVRDKLLILEYHRRSDDGEQYASVSSMIAFERSKVPGFEKQRSAAQIHGKDNACRTLLRLHRALKFLETMFRGLCEAELHVNMLKRSSSAITPLQSPSKSRSSPNSSTTDVKMDGSAHTIVSGAYETHLAAHHTWLVRNMVRVALRAVPSRSAMMKCIISSQRKTSSDSSGSNGSSNDDLPRKGAGAEGGEESTKRRLLKAVVSACDQMNLIHAIVQKLYESNDLVKLA